jgi:tRNA A-37 threonylcarbamoyl transferase component Bud32
MSSTRRTGPTASPGDASAALDLAGRTLGDYRILRRIGQGGMGQVYLAEQRSLKRNVALKILRAELAAAPASLQRFKAEAEAVAKVTHANIVQVYAYGEAEGFPYIALEYVEGRNLKEFVARKGPPKLPIALSIIRQIAAGLKRASEAGIIHRDVKPENILLTAKGGVKVADFGLSRNLIGEQQPLNLTQSGVIMGTPLYMSPEQVQGKPLDSRTDVYSLGVTCYYMLAGKPPFDGATPFDVAMKHARDEPPPLAAVCPDLPEALCAIVHKMMAKDPAERYQSAREILRDLARLRSGGAGSTMAASRPLSAVELPGVPAGSRSLPKAAFSFRPRGVVLYALIGASVVAALAVGVALGWMRRSVAAPPAVSAVNTTGAEEDVVPVNDEEALRKLADKYLQPANAGRDVSIGMGLCLNLSVLYLEQHRLDDADKLFDRLSKVPDVRPYRTLGRLGGAIVLALRDKAQESNKAFREIISTDPLLADVFKHAKEGKAEHTKENKVEPEFRTMWMNGSFRYWLARAVNFNLRNGVPEKDVPAAALRWRQPPEPKP